MNERNTRKDLIDPALLRAGWDVNNSAQVGLEIPVDGGDPLAWAALQVQLQAIRSQQGIPDVPLPSGISDYVLFSDNGEVLAVVEAKKTSINPALAQAQAEFYVREIEKRQGWKPFAFMTNGSSIYFLDVDRAPKRLVYGFFSKKDLENLLFARRHGTSLSATTINPSIVNRDYQFEAVRRTCEAFERGKRRTLVVMATGTGKTRTAMALTDVFLRSDQAKRILFVADRDALVQQALEEGFQEHLPNEPATRLFSHDLSTSSRLYVVTLQTLNNVLEQYTPAFFDLIIFDEVHRSIFNKYKAVLEYFDGRMIGLTATPAGFIDRNTFLSFDCDDVPTFLYGYDDAIHDGHLVDYELYQARTRFQREGIKGADLNQEEQDALTEQGIDPDELDYSGSDLERHVSNKDTLRRQWEEIMDVCRMDAGGTLPGKTILFALTEEHATRLLKVFEEMYPQWVGLAAVITYKSNYRGQTLKDFKKKSLPRIAISVDMLDTGVNVPEVMNLVIMKPVQSRIKLEQMIGRGTRNDAACKHKDWLPNHKKDGFLIIDFWQNDFGKTGEDAPTQGLPVNVRLFNTRLTQLELLLGRQDGIEAKRAIVKLREQLDSLPTEAFTIKRHWPEIEPTFEDGFWTFLTANKLQFLKLKVGPLLRYAVVEDVDAQTFTQKVESFKVGKLGGRSRTEPGSIQDDVGRVPTSILETDPDRETHEQTLRTDLETLSCAQLDEITDRLAKYMNRRTDRLSTFLELDLRDAIAERSYIVMDDRDVPVYATQYREIIERGINELAQNHPTVQAIAQGQSVSDAQLLALERTLREQFGRTYLQLDERNIRRAYGFKVGSLIEFMTRVLELPSMPGYPEILRRAFDEFIGEHTFSAAQIRFLNTVRNELRQRRKLELADLYDAPFTSLGQDAVERLFTPEEVRDIVAFTSTLSVAPAPRAA